MKIIYLTYQLIGSLIIVFGNDSIYIPWVLFSIPLSIYGCINLPDDLMFYKKGRIFSDQILRLVLIIMIFLSLLSAALFLDLTIIPFFLFVSFLTAYYYKKSFYTFNKFFKFLAYLGSAVFFIKYFILGMDINNIFMFSKNMLPIIFIPFIYSFTQEDSFRRSYKIFDYILLVFILFILILTISVSNYIFFISIITALIFPKNIGLIGFINSKSFYKLPILVKNLGLLAMIYLPIRYFFNLNFQIIFINYPEIYSYMPQLLKNILAGETFSGPRFQIWRDYFQFENIFQLIFGKHLDVFKYFNYENDSYVFLNNPHNTQILLHNNVGLAGLTIFLLLIISSLKTLFYKSFSQGIFLLGILIRSSSDDILLATGVSSFIIFTSLFNTSTSKISTLNS